MAGGSAWKAKELQRLRLVAGMMPVAEAVRLFPGRTRTGIQQKGFELGIVWKDRRRMTSVLDIARRIHVAPARVIAVADRVGIPLRRWGNGSRVPYAFTTEEVERIEEAVFHKDNPEHPDFELYYCRTCGAPTVKPWGWRWRTEARECGKRPLCHRCRVIARTTNRRAESYVLGSATRRARRAVREIERLQEAG